jgi:hypothetical protein
MLLALVLPTAPRGLAQAPGPDVLCYIPPNGLGADCSSIAEVGKLSSPSWNVDVVTGAEIGRVIQQLSSYELLVISPGVGTSLADFTPAIKAYVEGGGRLLLLDPAYGDDLDPSLAAPTSRDVTEKTAELTRLGQFTPRIGELKPENLPAVPVSIVRLATLGGGWVPQAKTGLGDQVSATLATAVLGDGSVVLSPGSLGNNTYARIVAEWAGRFDFVLFGPDLRVTAVEVTQAIQDLNNSVDLVAGKRTFVRVHVSSPTARSGITASLTGQLRLPGLPTPIPLGPTLTPINPGGTITVKPFPDRGQLNDSFLFELPAGWRNAPGTLDLVARVDPANTVFDPSLANNRRTQSVTLLGSQTMRLRIFNVRYSYGGVNRLAASSHLDALESWLRRAYPISTLVASRKTYVYPNAGLPNVDTLNSNLSLVRLFEILFGGVSRRTFYYGMVDDSGDFMRGKAAGIPGWVSSGPTGPGTFGWDTDGSYGDWYGGHEIGHSAGRSHANFCGAGGGGAYPYTGGRISPSLTGNTAIYGFDISTRAIYGPSWNDVMTYCNNQWVSDFTYEGIRSRLNTVNTSALAAAPQQGSYLLVSGRVSLADDTGALEVVNVLAGATEYVEEGGDWSIVLLNGDTVLDTHNFTPDALTDEEDDPSLPAVVSELLPWAAGTTRLQLRKGAAVVDERAVSANPPTVAITAPAGGALDNGPITVSWTGSDPDGDTLSYSVLFSNDNGATWTAVAADLAGTSLTVQGASLPGGAQSRFRVVASDGVLSAVADSAPFSLPDKAPEVTFETPAPGAVFFPAQPVNFAASASDLEDETLADAAFSWSSSRDGALGTGATLQTLGLSTGVHEITVTVTDSAGNSATATRSITVATGATPLSATLEAAPGVIGVTAQFLDPAQTVVVTTRRVGDGAELSWTAQSSASWARVRPAGGQAAATANGTTPTDLEVIVDTAALPVGEHRATITLTSGGQTQTIPVLVTVVGNRVNLPLIRR